MLAPVRKIVNAERTTRPAAAPVSQRPATGTVQRDPLIRFSPPADPAEREAEAVAREVVDRPALVSPYAARSRATAARVPRRSAGELSGKVEGRPSLAANVSADIQASLASGAPLPLSVRRFMEPRLAADLRHVRVHTGERAAALSRRLSAQAFTVGQHIFFGRDRFQPETREGRELIAHELAHTIQQGATTQRGPAVQRREEPEVRQRTPTMVQRLGIRDALDYFADKANLIPGFRMFTLVLGVNPINMSRVERSAANVLRAVVELLPGGGLITRALDNHGVFDRVGAWVERQIAGLGMSGALIRQAIDRFLDSLSWRDIFDLGGVWERAKRIFTEPIGRIIDFGRGLVTDILRFIKDAILLPLARLAEGTRGYDLLKAVLGQDPITGEPVPRTAETLIGGFMRLIGQEEVWNNLRRANAVARAWAWFRGALAGLLAFVREIPAQFRAALQALEIADIVLLPRAFAKVGGVFLGFIGRFFSWAGRQVLSLLQIIFEILAPAVMPYLRKAVGAFRKIIENPVGFVRNLVRAGIQGFQQFAENFLAHLRTSLIAWLTGTLAGANIYIPQAFELKEIVKFVLSVLGLTWQNIRQKLVRVIGETAVSVLERGFDIVVTLVTEGPAAAWEKIKENISNLKDMVMEQVMAFVRDRIVQAAITRLVTSLNPAGAFIQAVIAIYNTVMFFVERLRQIAQVAAAFIDSIAAIADGVIAAAANRVERTMAGLLTLVISFLARLVGLGKVSDAVVNIVNRIRAPIDRALDKVVEWIVATARRIGRLVAQVGVPQDPAERLRLASQAAVTAARALRGRITGGLLQPALAGIKVRYGLSEVAAYEEGGAWWARLKINPETKQKLVEGGEPEEVLEFIDTQIVRPVEGGAAILALPGGKTEIKGYQIRLGSATERASIRAVRRPAGAAPPIDVHIDDDGFLRRGARPEQRRSSEAELFARYREVADALGYADLFRGAKAEDATRSSNHEFRRELRQRILDDPKYATISQINVLLSSQHMTGSGMQGELFEAWVVKWFGAAHAIEDGKVSYKVEAGQGRMDRYSGNKIIEIKSRRRPDVPSTVPDDEIPPQRFSLEASDRAQFTKYKQLIDSRVQGVTKIDGKPAFVGPFVGARYYFNFLGVLRLFASNMPDTLRDVTEMYVGGARVEQS